MIQLTSKNTIHIPSKNPDYFQRKVRIPTDPKQISKVFRNNEVRLERDIYGLRGFPSKWMFWRQTLAVSIIPGIESCSNCVSGGAGINGFCRASPTGFNQRRSFKDPKKLPPRCSLFIVGGGGGALLDHFPFFSRRENSSDPITLHEPFPGSSPRHSVQSTN